MTHHPRGSRLHYRLDHQRKCHEEKRCNSLRLPSQLRLRDDDEPQRTEQGQNSVAHRCESRSVPGEDAAYKKRRQCRLKAGAVVLSRKEEQQKRQARHVNSRKRYTSVSSPWDFVTVERRIGREDQAAVLDFVAPDEESDKCGAPAHEETLRIAQTLAGPNNSQGGAHSAHHVGYAAMQNLRIACQ
jgi:hypothetical protein